MTKIISAPLTFSLRQTQAINRYMAFLGGTFVLRGQGRLL